MIDSEKGKFENAWKSAFSAAEQAPSEEVWAGVEQDLNRAETRAMRLRVVFYQRLAAASILFALLLGGLSTYYISRLTEPKKMTQVLENPTTLIQNKSINENGVAQSSQESIGGTLDEDNTAISDQVQDDLRKNEANGSKVMISDLSKPSFDYSQKIFNNGNGGLAPDIKSNQMRDYPSLLRRIPEPSVELKGELRNVTIIRILPAMPSSFMNSKKENQVKENLWAALGASTGNYSPSTDFTTASPSLYSNLDPSSGLRNSSQSAYSATSSKGTAYSVGMNLGKRISRRWLLQGGVSYLNQAIGYTSNYAVVDASNTVLASLADYSNFKSFSTIIPVSSLYQVNSVNEFISVPLQAGYMLVDKKIGLQLNSGVSTNIFMQNTLTDKSGQLATFSSGGGETSPYRTVSWAGLMGTELSYRIASHYRISIAPGLRYSLNPVLKSNAYPSNPLAWDVGFRFRYIIK